MHSTTTKNILMVVWAKPGSGSRRALEVSYRLGWNLHYSYPKTRYCKIRKFVWCLIDSIKTALHAKPEIIVVQIGPIAACLFGLAVTIGLGIPVMYDSHSAVYLPNRNLLLRAVQRIAYKASIGVLIHNEDHLEDVFALGGNPILLKDPIPVFPEIEGICDVTLNRPAVFCPLSWRSDEPIGILFETADQLKDFNFYLTGKPKYICRQQKNVKLTGFLHSEAYFSYLQSCDVVLALTTQKSTVCCAGHEAIAVRRPLITSDTSVLRERFRNYAMFAHADADELATKVRAAYASRNELTVAAGGRAEEMEVEWDEQCYAVSEVIHTRCSG